MSYKQINTTLIHLLALLLSVAMVRAEGPQILSNGGCSCGTGYDPNCDVNRDNRINVQDLSIVACRWG